jgi:hypothetical protein
MAAMEGELLKFTGGGRGWQRRHFTLANGLLFYRKVGLERSVSQATQGVDTADEYRGCLLCSACTFVSSNSNDCRFDLKVSQGVLPLRAASGAEQKAWLTALRQAKAEDAAALDTADGVGDVTPGRRLGATSGDPDALFNVDADAATRDADGGDSDGDKLAAPDLEMCEQAAALATDVMQAQRAVRRRLQSFEQAAAAALGGAAASDVFAAADGDGDGWLNRAEMQAAAASLLPDEPWDDALWPAMCADCGVDPAVGFGLAEFVEFLRTLRAPAAATATGGGGGIPRSSRRQEHQREIAKGTVDHLVQFVCAAEARLREHNAFWRARISDARRRGRHLANAALALASENSQLSAEGHASREDEDEDEGGEEADSDLEGFADALHTQEWHAEEEAEAADDGCPRLRGQHRLRLPSDKTTKKVTLWNILKELVGQDLTRVTLPVFLNEPLTFQQRLAEELDVWPLLDLAAGGEECPLHPADVAHPDWLAAAPLRGYDNVAVDSCLRLLHVAAFAVASYSTTDGRLSKPFNPLLGETFELRERGPGKIKQSDLSLVELRLYGDCMEVLRMRPEPTRWRRRLPPRRAGRAPPAGLGLPLPVCTGLPPDGGTDLRPPRGHRASDELPRYTGGGCAARPADGGHVLRR